MTQGNTQVIHSLKATELDLCSKKEGIAKNKIIDIEIGLLGTSRGGHGYPHFHP